MAISRDLHSPLEQILRRSDIWRGRSRDAGTRAAVATGHNQLDAGLLHGGWPRGGLIEVCQNDFQGEWLLFTPALRSLEPGLIVLLNPPAEPFSQALIQAGVDLDRLVVVDAPAKAQFLACFTELAHTGDCGAVLGWQPPDNLSYTEMRKCLLAAAGGTGLYTLFRPCSAQRQNSPAPLRLFTRVIPAGLEITVFKQKGLLQRSEPRPLVLPLPKPWRGSPPYHALHGERPAHGESSPPSPIDFRESS